MEIRAYSELYLSHAMHNLAVMFDYGIHHYGCPAPLFYNRFITSGMAEQFEKGNPKYLVGHSGIELADIVISLSGGGVILNSQEENTIGKSPEYWAGWVLAYYQWKSGRSFLQMQRNGIDINKVILMYHPFHEADLDKIADVAESIIEENIALHNPVKQYREQAGMTQKTLAERSGVSLRMIRAYEQKSQDITKAEYGTVVRLARALNLPSEALLG